MKNIAFISLLVIETLAIDSTNLLAQNCSVLLDSINGTYVGDCKNGKAEGKGEAKGICRYKGEFEAGMPNGSGTYFYSDSNYFIGNFLYGVKEGKGEWHQKINETDSVTKGYWSGNIYTDSVYTPYKFTTTTIATSDRIRVYHSKGIGKTVSFSIIMTSDAPDRPPITLRGGNGNPVFIREVFTEEKKISYGLGLF